MLWEGPETRFDLASITKPVVATLALVLDRRGELPLRTPVEEIWPAAVGFERRTLADLLRHRSGLQAWTPLWRRCRGRAGVERLLLSGEVGGAPRPLYSDLGYILWGLAAEKRLGRPLAALLRDRVLAPLHLESVSGPPGDRPDVAACELGNDHERALAVAQGIALAPRAGVLRGTPHDGNARFLGGVCGHAGLFGAAADLGRFGAEWLRPKKLLRREEVERSLTGRGPYALGWFRRRARGSAGPALGRRAFGLPGFPGVSLWIDPDTELVAVLLAHRRRGAPGLNPWRRRFHALAAAL